jgi:hypothetical protein
VGRVAPFDQQTSSIDNEDFILTAIAVKKLDGRM